MASPASHSASNRPTSGGTRTRVLRRPKPRPPKSLGVDVPNRLVIVGLLRPNDHRCILAWDALPRVGEWSGMTPEHAPTRELRRSARTVGRRSPSRASRRYRPGQERLDLSQRFLVRCHPDGLDQTTTHGRERGERTSNGCRGGRIALLLAIEGATLLRLQPLLTVHAFVGMLLIPVVALKLASTGWRMLRYYGGAEEYVGVGPPPLVLRALVAPVLILSTLVLLCDGSRATCPRSDGGDSRRPAQGKLHRLVRGGCSPRSSALLEAASPLADTGCGGWSPCCSHRRCPRSRSWFLRSRRCQRPTDYRTTRRLTYASTQTRRSAWTWPFTCASVRE